MNKICKQCGESKPHEEFSKRTASLDGLQHKCKSCNKIQNDLYRDKNSEYWSYETGYFSDKDKWKYILEYNRADKSIKIYKIELPNGEVYIGSTKRHMSVRMTAHLSDYRNWLMGLRQKYIPGLYDAFKKIGDMDEIRDWIKSNTYILEETIGERTRQLKREQWWMDKYTKEDRKLVNTYKAYNKNSVHRRYRMKGKQNV